ncbi:hypothetical protein RHECNPAF_14110050 [Rhizobium etli CNPAF512]|nr:hypothetical protein RHECNPAF_14110050 [Rhizobium etli CNPAF512]
MDTDFHRRFRLAGAGCGVGDRLAFELHLPDQFLLSRRQSVEQPLDIHAGRQHVLAEVAFDLLAKLGLGQPAPTVAAMMVDQLVAGDREEPGGERSLPVVGGSAGMQRQQCLLDQVFHIRFRRRSHPAAVITDEQHAQSGEQTPIGRLVPVKGEKHQCFQGFFRMGGGHAVREFIRKSSQSVTAKTKYFCASQLYHMHVKL